MIVVVDAGSTKADWCFLDKDNEPQVVCTEGINPVLHTEEEIGHILDFGLNDSLSRQDGSVFYGHSSSAIDTLYYYGAGCLDSNKESLAALLAAFFDIPETDTNVYSDLTGAARAVLGREAGIACILGTGANSCLYDGKEIVDHIPPLGFILGDEGSGAALGKMFVNALYKRRMPQSIADSFKAETGLGIDDVIRSVYREKMPNRFLASLSPFLARHVEEPSVRKIIIDNFRSFFVNNVKPYGCLDAKIGVVGSVAYVYRNLLKEAASIEGLAVDRVIKSPMAGLVQFHRQS